MLLKLNEKIITALPIFIAMNTATVIVWSMNVTTQGISLFLGIIAAGLVDLDNSLSGRLKNMLSTIIAFTLSSLVAQYFISQGLLFSIAITVMTFLFTMSGALGQRYSTIAFGALNVAVYTAITYSPEKNWYFNSMMMLTGTLLYGFVSIVVHLFFPNRPLQVRISNALMILADYLDAKAAFFDPDDLEQLTQKQINFALKESQLIDAFNECRVALFYRIKGNYRHSYISQMSRYYFAAQDIHERANSSEFDYKLLDSELKNSDLIFRVLRLLELQAQTCRDIAQSLQQKQPLQNNPRLERAILGLNQSFEGFSQHCRSRRILAQVKTLINNLKNTYWQLQSLSQGATSTKSVEPILIDDNASGIKRIIQAIRSQLNLQSELFRHATRLSIAVFVCCNLIDLLQLQSDRGYWILLTLILVCQPNYTATKLRLKQRIIGTISGVLVVGATILHIAPTLEAKLAIVIISSTLSYFFRINKNSYSLSTFFVTIQVLVNLDIMGFNIHDATLPRLIDTLVGTGLAWLAVSYLWPDWKYLNLTRSIQQAIKNNANYLLHIVAHLIFGKGNNLKYQNARDLAQNSASALSTIMTNMNNEPKKYASHLSLGFKLLKLNTALLGYISALGCYRYQIENTEQREQLLAEFYPIAKKLIRLLETLSQLSAVQFKQLFEQLELALKQSNQQTDNTNTAFNIPMQQLNLITQLLPSLYPVIKQQRVQQKIKDRKNDNA